VPSSTTVSSESTIAENGELMMSVETICCSVYCISPASGPLSLAAFSAPLSSSTLVGRSHSTVRSTTEPVGTGARTANPFSRPCSAGITRPMALAAPVDAGIRLIAAARARRRSLCGKSCRRWSAV